MITLDLNTDEREELRDMLNALLSDLRMEVADTDRLDYRERLKERKAVISKVLAALDRG